MSGINRRAWLIHLALVSLLLWGAAPLAADTGAGTKETVLGRNSAGSSPDVSREVLEQYGARTVDEGLRSMAGLWTERPASRMVLEPAFSLRGWAGTARTQVLMNGLSVNQPYDGSVAWNHFSPLDLDRISTSYASAAASTHGGNGLAGVVRVRTPAPNGLGAGARLGVGTDDAFRYGFYAQDRVVTDRLGVRVAFDRQMENGYEDELVDRPVTAGAGNLHGGGPVTWRDGSLRWVCGNTGERGADMWSASLGASYAVGEAGEVGVRLVRSRHETFLDYPETYLRNGNGSPAFSGTARVYGVRGAPVAPSNYLAGISEEEWTNPSAYYRQDLGQMKLDARADWQLFEQWKGEPLAVPASGFYGTAPGVLTRTRSDRWQGVLDLEFPFSLGGREHSAGVGGYYSSVAYHQERHRLVLFRDLDDRMGDALSAVDAEQEQFEARLWAKASPVDRLVVETSLLGAWWNVSGGAAGGPWLQETSAENSDRAASGAFQATVELWDDKTWVDASASRTFRMPTLEELYRQDTEGGVTMLGTPRLDPETAWTYEAGVTQNLWESRILLRASAFAQRASDYIAYVEAIPGSGVFRARNVGDADVHGFEVRVELDPCPHFNLWAGYSRAETELDGSVIRPDMAGAAFMDAPESMWKIGGRLEYWKARLTALGVWAGRTWATPDNTDVLGAYGGYGNHWIWDAQLAFLLTDRSRAAITAHNLFDQDYYHLTTAGADQKILGELRFDW
ncbi:MAG: TonB-dependent receptor [Desulfatibacillaceae bacterium]